MKKIAVGIGEVLWDMLPQGRKIGGAPANFAYHISQFGIAGCVVSAVGNDDLGEEIISDFTSKGLRHHIARVPYPTGAVLIDVDSDGIPRYDFRPDAAWDNIPYSTALRQFAADTAAVCFGSLAQRGEVSRSTISRFIDDIPADNNPLIVFDANLRQNFFDAGILDSSMRRCNILKINDEELETLSRMHDFGPAGPDDRCRRLSEIYGLRMLILTCGTAGSYIFSAEGVSFQATPAVKVADTVGAGDSFTAAFIAGLLRGETIRDAHSRAVSTSAYVCTCQGAMPQLPPSLTL